MDFSSVGGIAIPQEMSAGDFLTNKLPASVARTAEGIAVGQVQPAINIGDIIKDIVTGAPARELTNKITGNEIPAKQPIDFSSIGGHPVVSPLNAAVSELVKPSSLSDIENIQAGAVNTKNQAGEFAENPKEYAYNNPAEVLAATTIPFGAKAMLKEGGLIKPSGKTVKVSEQLATVLPMSGKDLEAITNPNVADVATTNIMAHKADIANDAVDAVNALPQTLKKVGSDIYQKAGIDSEKTAVPVFDALSQAEAENTQSLAKANTPDNIRAVKEVRETINNAINKIDDNGNMPFGQVVEITKEMYDNAQSAGKAGDTFKQNYYENLGDKLTQAKYQIPEIKDIAPQYQQLMQANDSLNKVFRINSDRGKMTLDTKIENLSKSESNVARLQEMDNIYNALDAHPEYPELNDVKDKIQRLQIVANAEKGKALDTNLLSKVPLVGNMANQVIKHVTTPVAGFMGRNNLLSPTGMSSRISEGKVPIASKVIATINALRNASSMPLQPMSIAKLVSQGGNPDILKNTIQNLITK